MNAAGLRTFEVMTGGKKNSHGNIEHNGSPTACGGTGVIAVHPLAGFFKAASSPFFPATRYRNSHWREK
jgi:hypothetical protein